jgi:hypothetical protein
MARIASGSRASVSRFVVVIVGHAFEFLRRFLLHVLPTGLVRIMYFGLFANRVRAENLDQRRALIEADPRPSASTSALRTPSAPKATEEERNLCPSCGIGQLRWVAILPRAPVPDLEAWAPTAWDTS